MLSTAGMSLVIRSTPCAGRGLHHEAGPAAADLIAGAALTEVHGALGIACFARNTAIFPFAGTGINTTARPTAIPGRPKSLCTTSVTCVVIGTVQTGSVATLSMNEGWFTDAAQPEADIRLGAYVSGAEVFAVLVSICTRSAAVI